MKRQTMAILVALVGLALCAPLCAQDDPAREVLYQTPSIGR